MVIVIALVIAVFCAVIFAISWQIEKGVAIEMETSRDIYRDGMEAREAELHVAKKMLDDLQAEQDDARVKYIKLRDALQDLLTDSSE